MNYVFISPNYPRACASFCDRLFRAGVNVLGIGDAPWDSLDGRLRESLTEYYAVPSLEDYDAVYRAVAFYISKYGRIDWLESLNEYWLPQDARLRTDFNIAVGTRSDGIAALVEKSRMKEVFLRAQAPTARQHAVTDRAAGLAFAAETGYPLIVKPNIGVGAIGARKLEDEAQLQAFYDALPPEPYVMEEFLSGDICTYDAILDSRCEPLFESMNTYAPVMDAVLNDDDVSFYTSPEPAKRLRELGRRLVRAFGADRRFVHFEFIRLAEAKAGVGEAGEYAVMEVNMRPAGGCDPDMMNYAQSADVFQIYAEMVTEDRRVFPESEDRRFCAYVGRKDGRRYRRSHEELLERYGAEIVLQTELPPTDWPQMGRYVYLARFRTEEELNAFFSFALGKEE